MVQHRTFMDLALDDAGLHTPDGTLNLSSITRAEVIRHRSRQGGQTRTETSPGGVIGGALLGGAIAGPIGLVAGGLLGSNVKHESSASEGIPRTTSASLIFESAELAYSMVVTRERLEEAESFVAAVKGAADLR
ncbi:MAG: hypothetical protein U1E29_11050 [Coriobacteriia bacterium]|nr:hypothetical protein [Coriobacteriia bacterium]